MTDKEPLIYNSTEQRLYFKGKRLQFAGVKHYNLERTGHKMEIKQ